MGRVKNVEPDEAAVEKVAAMLKARRSTEYMSIDALAEAARNPKKHDEPNLDRSLGRFGFTEPLILDERTQRLVAGHGRLQALKRLRQAGKEPPEGVEQGAAGQWLVPVSRGWSSRSDDDAEAYLLASNQLTIGGGWDNKELGALLLELSEKDPLLLAGIGFDDKALMKLLDDTQPKAGKTDPDDVPDKIGAIFVEPGQMYRLGDHLLYCGDSTQEAPYDALLQGALADIIWTDPPWNVDYGASTNPAGWSSKHEKIANDNLGEAFPGFCTAFSKAMGKHSKPGAMIYLAMSAQEWPTIHAALLAAGFHWSSTIIWVKDSLVLSRKDYHTQYEPLWYGWQGDAARLRPLEDRTQSDVWNVPRPKKSDDHPTMKPVELIERALVNSSMRGDIVLEPFSGSGSVIMACERVGRRARAIEMEPKYVQTTIVRWQEFTGKTAERVS